MKFLDRCLFVKGVHSLRPYKERRPINVFNQKLRKADKSVERKDVDPKLYMRDTIRNIYNVLRNSTWDSAQEHLERLSIRWDSYTINQVLKTHPPMEKAWLFFNWASKLKSFKHDQFTYTTMLDIFGEAGRISSMNYVFVQMQEKGVKIDAVTYTSLMHWLSNSGDVDGAMKLWEEMKAKDCSPSLVTYTAYMKILFDNNKVEEAIDVYKEILKCGFSPNCHTYTILMEHLMGSGRYIEALGIFDKMQEAGVHPDKAACNILIEKCCKSRETLSMTKILEYMKENHLVLRYPVFLEALETLKNARKSDSLLRQVNPHISTEYISKEVAVEFGKDSIDTSITDTGLVSLLLKKKNLNSVDHLLIGMLDKNIKLDSEIISTIVEVNCSLNRPDGALLAFKYCLRVGAIIKRNACIDLIGILIRSNLLSNVLDVVQETIRVGHSLGVYLSALLIYRFGKTRKPHSAVKIFNLLPDDLKCTATYTALMSAYFSAGNDEKGLKTFKIMQKKGLAPSIGTYNVLLAGLEKSTRNSEAEIYRKEKKSLQTLGQTNVTKAMEERICDLLFGGNLGIR